MQTSLFDYDNVRHTFRTVSQFFNTDINHFFFASALFYKFIIIFRIMFLALYWSQLIEFLLLLFLYISYAYYLKIAFKFV